MQKSLIGSRQFLVVDKMEFWMGKVKAKTKEKKKESLEKTKYVVVLAIYTEIYLCSCTVCKPEKRVLILLNGEPEKRVLNIYLSE